MKSRKSAVVISEQMATGLLFVVVMVFWFEEGSS